jgi:NAD+ synthase (glutamine-hydrolysing)
VKIALAQLNPTIGDFDGNLRLLNDALTQAEAAGADLMVTSELAICGYPPRDLLEREAFLTGAGRALTRFAQRASTTAVIVGFPEVLPASATGRRIANSAAVVHEGVIKSIHRKSLLPTYDVFDEWRYFEPSTSVATTTIAGRVVGISICEDIWNDADFWPHRLYRVDPVEQLVKAGAEILVNVSASPYTIEKRHLRPRMLGETARRWQRPLIFVNQVGGHDDLVFDGASLAIDARGEVVGRGKEHEPDVVIVDLDREVRAGGMPAIEKGATVATETERSDAQSALGALVLGTRDYARRCGFKSAVLGLSGGIDSALVACIAARALGPKNVLGVAMPSRYSSEGSRTDAAELARNLGIDYRELPIEEVHTAYLNTLAPTFAGRAADVTEENLQARIRGALLMALSNKFGSLLLTTGNKSELATGYCTLYGDMCGGLAVISDVPKTLVYELSRAFNAEAGRAVIPESTLTKPPSAELRPDQKDQDSLPPYEVLDAILRAHLEEGLDRDALVAAGHAASVVDDVLRLVRISEYKRRQAAPGIKITGKAFGPGRRYPIAHAFRG